MQQLRSYAGFPFALIFKLESYLSELKRPIFIQIGSIIQFERQTTKCIISIITLAES